MRETEAITEPEERVEFDSPEAWGMGIAKRGAFFRSRTSYSLLEAIIMLIQKAFQYELRPDGATRRTFSRFAGARRVVWNAALKQPKYLGYNKNSSLLPGWKVEKPWLKEINAQVLQQGLMDLDKAFKNFFAKRAERPKPKKKGKCSDSFRFPQGFRVEEGNSRMYLPKVGWVRYRNSRSLRGVAKNIMIARKADRWYASIQTEFEVEEPIHPSTSQIGIDLGIARFASLSDGSFVEPLNAFKKHAYRLRRYQRSMSRKVKFSSNWKKAKAKVAKLHEAIANSRKDFLHKTSSNLAKTHSLICVEDLKVGNMSRSSAGTAEKPGKKVRQKSGLNRSILDQGWSEFRRMLDYKLRWLGGRLIAVPAMNTSRACPECRHISADNRKTQAEFACVECGYAANADYVGARNILAAGLVVFEGSALEDACGGDLEVRGPMKQEPIEVTLCYA
jgi:putative transposase